MSQPFSLRRPIVLPNFLEWCQQLFKTGSKEDNPDAIRTHGFMGKDYQISVIRSSDNINEMFEKLYDQYIISLTDGIPQRICMDEKLSNPYFMYFQDLDIISHEPIDDSFMHDLIRHIVKIVSSFFPGLYLCSQEKSSDPLDEEKNDIEKCKKKYNHFDIESGEWLGSGTGRNRLRCMISFPDEQNDYGGVGKIPKKKIDHSTKENNIITYYKHAAHLNWIGRLHVTPTQAKLITATCAMKMNNLCGERSKEKGENDWKEIFDMNVYNENQGGLRMLLSWKVERCSECSKSKKKLKTKNISVCNLCEYGWIWKDRRYVPHYVLDADGNRDLKADWIIEDPYVFVRAACIRSNALELISEFVIPSDCPLKEEDFNSSLSKDITKYEYPNKKNNSLRIGRLLKRNENNYSNESLLILDLIKNSSPHHKWDDLFELKLTKSENNMIFVANVKGISGHRYCMNIGNYHSSSNIWFIINENGIKQRCFSPHHGCQSFGSDYLTIIPDELRDLLFFEELQKNNTLINRWYGPKKRSLTSTSNSSNNSLSSTTFASINEIIEDENNIFENQLTPTKAYSTFSKELPKKDRSQRKESPKNNIQITALKVMLTNLSLQKFPNETRTIIENQNMKKHKRKKTNLGKTN